MKTDYLSMAQTGFLAVTSLCLVLVLIGTRKTYLKMGLHSAQANKRTFLIALIFLGWIAYVSVLSLKGILSDFSTFPPKFPLVTIPPFVAILVLTFHPKFRKFIMHIPSRWLIYLQAFRLHIEILLWWLFLANVLPVQMTFEGRNLDILTGISAPVIGWLCFGNKRNNRKLALIWNLVGLGLLLNIVATAILSLPTSFRCFMNDPDSSFVSTFPTVFLPTILVPLAYSLHFFSLRKIWLEKKKTNEKEQAGY